MGRLQDKACLITGAAKGIGLATSELFAREGARVLLTDIDPVAGIAATNALGEQGLSVAFLPQDVTDPAQWHKALDHCEKLFGSIDVLVNNAGVGEFCDVERMSLEQWRHTLACNLDSVFLGTQQVIGRMKERGGSIINVASIEGLIGDPLVPAYNASKGAVRLFTRSVAAHCARQGYAIRVNALCPGYVDTPMVQGALADAPAEQARFMQDYLRQRIPMGRMALPEEIARAMLFLASDDSNYMTGADLVVDGGYLAQ